MSIVGVSFARVGASFAWQCRRFPRGDGRWAEPTYTSTDCVNADTFSLGDLCACYWLSGWTMAQTIPASTIGWIFNQHWLRMLWPFLISSNTGYSGTTVQFVNQMKCSIYPWVLLRCCALTFSAIPRGIARSAQPVVLSPWNEMSQVLLQVCRSCGQLKWRYNLCVPFCGHVCRWRGGPGR